MKETKIWWDFTTLKKYMEFKMVPRGLRLKKILKTIYNDEFLDKWNSILTECSFKLIESIISFEETELNHTRDEIKVAQNNLKKLKIGEEYKTLDGKINKNIADLQKSMSEMKKNLNLIEIVVIINLIKYTLVIEIKVLPQGLS